MKNNQTKTTSTTIDSWIKEQELPPRAQLKVIRRFDGLYPEDPIERDAYWDFISWAMSREHAIILSLPRLNIRENDLPSLAPEETA